MAISRFYSEKDTWITNVRLNSLSTTRASGSNLGRDPSLNVFARKGEITSASLELAHTLMQFPISALSASIFTDLTIPSGSVEYKLHLFEMIHDDPVPTTLAIDVHPLSRNWAEGNGLDVENFSDSGFANWEMATESVNWTVTGSDFTSLSSSQNFPEGTGNLEIDVTQIINEWLTGSTSNNGFVLKLTDDGENNGINKYRKAFHSRETLFVDKIPYLEARWDDVTKDNHHNFAFDSNNTLILQNYIRGEKTTLASPVSVTVRNPLTGTAVYSHSFTAAEVSTGIFTASILISSTGSYSGSLFYGIWDSNGTTKLTSSFQPLLLTGSTNNVDKNYTVNMNNRKRVYSTNEEIRFTVNVRERDFVTHVGIIGTASLTPETTCVEKMYFSVKNAETGGDVVPFGTGSYNHTQLSYDSKGNYFDFNMKWLVPGFLYEFEFLLDVDNQKQVVADQFKFKVK